MIVLLGISCSPALKQLSSARALTVSGHKITRMLNAARQNAITSQALTALIVLTEQGSEGDFRTFTIAERSEDGTWHQITNWERLAAGVTLEVNPRHCAFTSNLLPLPGYTADQIAYCDRPLTSQEFAYLIFHPDGGLGTSDRTAQIRLVEKRLTKSIHAVEVGHNRSESTAPGTFFDIAVAGATGALKTQKH